MALIKCTECGKEFSDRAVACPNCGCPTDIILEDIEKEKSIQQKKIVASYDIGDCIFRKNCASVPEERSAIPLQTEQSSAG